MKNSAGLRRSSPGECKVWERQRFAPEGKAMNNIDSDGALDTWIPPLLDSLLGLYPLPRGLEILPPGLLPPPRISVLNVSATAPNQQVDLLEIAQDYHRAVLKCNQRITAEDWYQDVRHLELRFTDDIVYEPGDVAVIHPEAPEADVESFLSSMGWENVADDLLAMESQFPDQPFPENVPKIASLRTLFTRFLDINAVPRRSFFQLLRHFTKDQKETEKLEEFISSEGTDDLYEYCLRVKRTIREVLAEFRSATVPREYIFDLFPPMRPRLFSIASSSKVHSNEIHLCVAIVRYKTKLKIPRRGVCTTFLASLHQGDTLMVGIQKSLFTLPSNDDIPLICVGPGTGIAPVRSIIESRLHAGIHDNTLYFGCRSATKDQHYHTEWSRYAKDTSLMYRVACSRDVPEGTRRVYVQDLIRDDSERIWELVGEKGACVFISGSSNKMPTAVKEAIRFAVEKHSGKTAEEVYEFMTAMESNHKLVEECWS